MQIRQSYSQPFIIAIVFHIIVFLLLALGFQFSGKNFVVENVNNAPIINAMVMNPMPAPPKVTPAPLPTPPAPQPVKPEPVKQQVAKPIEKPVVIPPKKDVLAINNKKQKKLQKELLEKQLLSELKKQQDKQKKIKQKVLENALANEIKNLSAKKKQSDIQRANAEREQKAQGIVDKYKALILQAIGQHWIIPDGVDKKLATKLVIYLAPGGMVLNAEIYESSGNVALDNSARAAVFKSSPLPVPTDAEEFKFFKRFVLVFRPMYFQHGQFELGANAAFSQA